MCSYQGFEFGAGTYPDSICIDGRLFDADACDDEGNLYEPMEEIPCPICRREDAIDWRADDYHHLGHGRRKARKMATLVVDDIRANHVNRSQESANG